LLRKQRKTLGGYFLPCPVHISIRQTDSQKCKPPPMLWQSFTLYPPRDSTPTFALSSNFSESIAIAILFDRLSVRPSVTRVDQSKTVQARITKSSKSAA